MLSVYFRNVDAGSLCCLIQHSWLSAIAEMHAVSHATTDPLLCYAVACKQILEDA